MLAVRQLRQRLLRGSQVNPDYIPLVPGLITSAVLTALALGMFYLNHITRNDRRNR